MSEICTNCEGSKRLDCVASRDAFGEDQGGLVDVPEYDCPHCQGSGLEPTSEVPTLSPEELKQTEYYLERIDHAVQRTLGPDASSDEVAAMIGVLVSVGASLTGGFEDATKEDFLAICGDNYDACQTAAEAGGIDFPIQD